MFKLNVYLASSLVALLICELSVEVEANAVKIVVPLYLYPDDSNNYWESFTQSVAASKASVLAIIGVENGPAGSKPNSDYTKGMRKLKQNGITSIGYVYTSIGKRNLTKVFADIDAYSRWPVDTRVQGIFLDEAANKASAKNLAYYQAIYNYVKTKFGTSSTVMTNPGTNADEAFFSPNTKATDVGMIFESYFSDWLTYRTDSYVTKYNPNQFAMIAHTCASAANMSKAIALAKQRNFGYVYVTDALMPDPYDTFPSYFSSELSIASSA